MKKILFWMVVLISALFTLLPAQIEQKEFSVEPGKRLEMDLRMGGSIAISGWDQKKVQIAVNYKDTNKEDWQIEFSQSDAGVRVEGRARNHRGGHSLEFNVRVPRNFDLKLRSMGGSIAIDNVAGMIGGRTMGGALDLKGLKGRIELTTMGGEITLKDSDLDGELRTMGGRVLFENVIGDVKGSSMGGNVIYKNVKPRSGDGGGKAVRISTMGGDINVETATEGAEVHTMGGEIHIKSAAKFVNAKTMGGDITIDAVDGSVKATTMGGDIKVTETGKGTDVKEIALKTMGGDVILLVPENFEMEIAIEIALDRHGREDRKIVSDFPLEQSRGRKADDEHRDREYLFGKGKVGSGRNKVTLITAGGDVYLQKAK